jgi:undecaprenyl-diphosphatase
MDIFGLIIELLKALAIGVIEGITEWLPVSSTGHMIVADDFIKLDVSAQFWEMFLVVIQLGAIMAVIVLYFHRLNPFSHKKTPIQRSNTWRLWGKVILACIPAAVIGFALDDWVEENFFNAVTVALALVVYGVAFILVEKFKASPLQTLPIGAHSKVAVSDCNTRGASTSSQQESAGISEVNTLSIPRALLIGCFQCLAIVPGTSRSGSTILGGRLLGVSREASAEFSFFLAIPVMFGWSLLKLAKTFIGGIELNTTEWSVFATGIIVAFVVSLLAIRFLMGYIKKHSFAAFGWYRIALGLILLAYFALNGRLLGA